MSAENRSSTHINTMPKAFLFTNKRYGLLQYFNNGNVPENCEGDSCKKSSNNLEFFESEKKCKELLTSSQPQSTSLSGNNSLGGGQPLNLHMAQTKNNNNWRSKDNGGGVAKKCNSQAVRHVILPKKLRLMRLVREEQAKESSLSSVQSPSPSPNENERPTEVDKSSVVANNQYGGQSRTPYFEHGDIQEEPVNLSIKKVDLFNLTQLAEVSLAAAKGELLEKIKHRDLREVSVANIEKTIDHPLKKNIHRTPNSSIIKPESASKTGSSTKNKKQLAATVGKHVCTECNKAFSTLSNLARHRQTHLSLSSSSVKKCPHCDKMYVSMPAFSMHLRTHNQGCKCMYCGKGFSRPWLLQGHLRTHTGEKPFKCNICGKAFADKSNLRAHTQTHSSEKPFVCSRCGKPFALKSYLCKHIESSCMKAQKTPRQGKHGSKGNQFKSNVNAATNKSKPSPPIGSNSSVSQSGTESNSDL